MLIFDLSNFCRTLLLLKFGNEYLYANCCNTATKIASTVATCGTTATVPWFALPWFASNTTVKCIYHSSKMQTTAMQTMAFFPLLYCHSLHCHGLLHIKVNWGDTADCIQIYAPYNVSTIDFVDLMSHFSLKFWTNYNFS